MLRELELDLEDKLWLLPPAAGGGDGDDGDGHHGRESEPEPEPAAEECPFDAVADFTAAFAAVAAVEFGRGGFWIIEWCGRRLALSCRGTILT